MPLELEIIRAREFIRVGAEGRFDLAASKAGLATLADACRKRGLQDAVLDLRALQPGPTPVFTPGDLIELVNTFPEVGFSKRLRLAILYRSDPHRRARLFSFLSLLHGWNVRAFGDFEAALRWLSKGQQAPEAAHRNAVQDSIPINVGSGATEVPIQPVSAPNRRGHRRRAHARPTSVVRRQERLGRA